MINYPEKFMDNFIVGSIMQPFIAIFWLCTTIILMKI